VGVLKVLKLVRKFPWTNVEVSLVSIAVSTLYNYSQIFQYGIHCFTNIWKVKFNNIDCVANLLAGLASYQVIEIL